MRTPRSRLKFPCLRWNQKQTEEHICRPIFQSRSLFISVRRTEARREALGRCFAESAVVRDEGKTIEGLAAIKKWMVETKQKYQHTIEPLASTQKDGKTIVTNRLTGNFPGSPIELEFVFMLDHDKIAALEILS